MAQAYLVHDSIVVRRMVRRFSAAVFEGQTNSTSSGNLIVGENKGGKRLPFVSSVH